MVVVVANVFVGVVAATVVHQPKFLRTIFFAHSRRCGDGVRRTRYRSKQGRRSAIGGGSGSRHRRGSQSSRYDRGQA